VYNKAVGEVGILVTFVLHIITGYSVPNILQIGQHIIIIIIIIHA